MMAVRRGAMTEAEWLGCREPQPLLEFLQGKASDRKLRLFACACCRCVGHLLPDRRRRKVVQASERFADGQITTEKLQFVRGDARWAANVASRKSEGSEGVKWTIASLAEPDVQLVLFAVRRAADLGGREIQRPIQSGVIRDLLGNPFRPVNLMSVWLTPTVVSLAEAAYDERVLPSGELDQQRLAVLADALEEAGCTSGEILEHLRSPGPHVRGCWVVDLILGKS